jgi:hypothetical protein
MQALCPQGSINVSPRVSSDCRATRHIAMNHINAIYTPGKLDKNTLLSPMAQQLLEGQGLLIIEASRSHSRHTTRGRTPLDE